MKKHGAVSRQKRTASGPSSQPALHPIAGRKPLIFLASSTESRKALNDIALFVEASGGKSLPWPEAFPVGQYPLESLIEASRKVDGALILASADDKVIQRGKPVWTPRDNILVELGIFVSALSRTRAALVYAVPDEVQVRLPSDLNGLTYLRYDPDMPAHNEKKVCEWMARFFTESLREGLPSPTGGHYSWHEVIRGLEHIQNELERNGFRPDLVLGLGRSGGVVGGILTSLLASIPLRLWDLRYTEGKNVVDVEFSDGTPQFPAGTKRVLVIEGATTSGQTPKKAKELLAKKFPKIDFRFAVLIQSVQSAFVADYYAYLETGALAPLPWHGPLSRTFLTPGLRVAATG